jgi:hypothetical protein
MDKILLYVILIISFICCKGNGDDSISKIEIEKNIDNFKPFKLSDLDCELEYIVLETISDAILMDIRFVDIYDDYILISDTDKCLLFSCCSKQR